MPRLNLRIKKSGRLALTERKKAIRTFFVKLGVFFLLASLVQAKTVDNDIDVARLLAEQAKIYRDAGEIVRPYYLFSEAAKRDPRVVDYREQRNLLAPLAKLMLKNKFEASNVNPEIAAAELEAAAERNRPELKRDSPALKTRPSPEIVTRSADSTQTSESKPVPVANFQSVAEQAVSKPAPTNGPQQLPSTIPTTGAPQPKSTQPTDDDPTPRDRSNTPTFSFASQILGYGTYDAIRQDSVFNPGNQLADFHRMDFHAALRPDLKFTESILSFTAKPRVDYDLHSGTSRNEVDSYLQEWSVRLQALPSLNISYGREVPMWGPSMSLPASNPFFRDNNRNTPLLEIGARDFGRILWQPNSKFAISYIANTALRRGVPDFLPFKPTAAVKADYNGKNLLFSGIYSAGISSPLGQRKFIGGYAQVSAGKALRFYVDGSAQQGNPGYYPQNRATPLGTGYGVGYGLTNLNHSLTPRTIVGGLAYTDTAANTWTAEYIYNAFGYDHLLANDFYRSAQQLDGVFLQGGQNAGLAANELALTANPGIGPLRRNYAFGQYQRNGLANAFDVVVRYTLSIDDRSGEGVAYVTWNTSDHLQFFAVVAGMNGSVDTEFARYLHYQAQVGFRIFLH